jgi:hypothetical protein
VQRVEDRAGFDENLLAPLPGSRKVRPSATEIDDDGAAFMNFMGAVNG